MFEYESGCIFQVPSENELLEATYQVMIMSVIILLGGGRIGVEAVRDLKSLYK